MSRFVYFAAVYLFVLGVLALDAPAQDDRPPVGGPGSGAEGEIIKVFTLLNADAREIQRIVGDLVEPTDSRQSTAGRTRGSSPSIRMSSDPRTNSLIVIGPPSDLDVIQALLLKLDAMTPKENVPEAVDVSQLRSRVDRLEQLIERLDGANGDRGRSTKSDRDRSGGASAPPSQTGRAADASGTRVRVEARSRQDAPLEVVSVVAAGQRVKKGHLLLKINTNPIEDFVKVQEFEVQLARTELIECEVRLKSAVLQQETVVGEANRQVELAKIELAEFQEGARTQQLQLHEKEVKQAQRHLDRQQQLAEAGKADGKLEEAKDALDIAETKLQTFQKFTAPKIVRQLESEIDAAKFKLQRVRGKTEADVKAAEAELASRRAQVELEVHKLKCLHIDVANCKIFAPHDGVVAADGLLPISAGSKVRKGQVVLILIPDEELAKSSRLEIPATLEPSEVMRALIKLNAATAKELEPGQRVDVQVDAFPGQEFNGTLTEILNEKESLENALAWILIDDAKGIDLRAGMTAVVSIELDR